MSLVLCEECQKEISDRALTCPHCGFSYKYEEEEERRITIEQTSKRWKQNYIMAFMFLIMGGAIALNGLARKNSSLIYLGFVTMFFSLIYIFYVRIRAWWDNG